MYFAKHRKHIKEGSGSGRIRSFGVRRIRIRILKTGSADPDPKKMDRIRNTDLTRTAKYRPFNEIDFAIV